MEKKKMNDKGFSLVELIIVIAIMAILIAVLAPQYLKFVERSKKSADRDTVDQIIRAVQIDYADPETSNNPDGHYVKVSTTAAKVTDSGVCDATVMSTILTGTGIDRIQLKSSQWSNGSADVTEIYIHFVVDSNGNVQSYVTDNASLGASPATNITDGTKLITE